ncbi:hypothetical protein I4F81_011782 [Pyropia yezoensis]|uniref:Uncharacterized protein n=1 Tax=Pyropia yezoensis TaxID=2788 RepID=A0ACC3CHA5_PYRYE|nr:hypothetical protein I4F81_011782 [Neopyropia yezoensis]
MNSTTSPGLAAQAPTPTAPANEAPATTGLPGIPALPVDSGPDTLPAPRPGFDFAKAELYLSRLSSMDLRQVLRVLRIKGKMGAPVKEKRSSALEMMRARDMGDEEVEALVDDLDIESASAHSGLAPRTLSSLLTCEVGLPNRTRVEDTEPTPAKRAKVAHVAVQGLSGLTSALAGFAKAMAPASSAGTTAAEIYDNAESIGAVTKQLRAARQDLLADPTDEIAARVVKHLELQVSKLLG